MQVEPRADTGHPGGVLAKKLLEAIEAHVRTGVSYAQIARAAGMSPQQLANMKAAVAADSDHAIRTDVAERLADVVGYELALVPKAPTEGGRS